MYVKCTIKCENFHIGFEGLFSRNYMRSFMKIKPSRNGEITLSFTDVVNHALIANF